MWPLRDAFSRTSGTGRLVAGAFEWTDWVYDAYGAASPAGVPGRTPTSLTPGAGRLRSTPGGKAAGNGADIFRAAVGVDGPDTVWRVDWNTLARPRGPDRRVDVRYRRRRGDRRRGVAGERERDLPGIDKALVVSAKGARLVDVVTGATIADLPTAVDTDARSFVVRVPRAVLPIDGAWRIRPAAGLADEAGTGFDVPTTSGAPASPTAPRVYNVTFRRAEQEPSIHRSGRTGELATGLREALRGTPLAGAWGQELANVVTANFWGEDAQAEALAAGDVSPFSQVVDWRDLRRGRTTEAPPVKGWSARWVVNGLGLGQGVADGGAYPSFLGRVQPYAVYVPRSYTGRRAVPLTWMLHSADSNYNQYAGLNPRMTEDLCEARRSICATTNGFGGGALYGGDVAQHEVWQVWRQLTLGYRIARDRTAVTGYSAGGVGSFRLSHSYPSAFGAAMPLDGGFEEACSSGGRGRAELRHGDRSRPQRERPLGPGRHVERLRRRALAVHRRARAGAALPGHGRPLQPVLDD